MIRLENIKKSYKTPKGNRTVLNRVNMTFESGVNLGVLGLNGAGKSTLLRIVGGAEQPDSGRITRTKRVSWPIGFSGSFHGSLTGKENLRFTSRIYGADIRKVTSFVKEFTELGDYLDMPFKVYSAGMKAKLAFSLSMAIGFDYYLIDEAFSVGDVTFRRRAEQLFEERKQHATVIVVSHNIQTIRKYCDNAVVLMNGKLNTFPRLQGAVHFYKKICDAKM